MQLTFSMAQMLTARFIQDGFSDEALVELSSYVSSLCLFSEKSTKDTYDELKMVYDSLYPYVVRNYKIRGFVYLIKEMMLRIRTKAMSEQLSIAEQKLLSYFTYVEKIEERYLRSIFRLDETAFDATLEKMVQQNILQREDKFLILTIFGKRISRFLSLNTIPASHEAYMIVPTADGSSQLYGFYIIDAHVIGFVNNSETYDMEFSFEHPEAVFERADDFFSDDLVLKTIKKGINKWIEGAQ